MSHPQPDDPTNTASHAGLDEGGFPIWANAIPQASASGNGIAAAASPSRYLLGEEIARGGMGEVYRATDTVLNREVAVKVLQAKYGPESGPAHRFADEARITGQLQHPAIPPVHDLGTLPDGRPFLAMKLIKGQTLDDLLKARIDSSAERGRFVAVFESVCQAVAYAHAHDVIHRDLKPANVMVGAFGEVQVMDWGLAKVLTNRGREGTAADPNETVSGTEVVSLRDSDGSFTQAGSVLGTPAFMPPEQAVGAVSAIDRRSDVFGLGAILAVILTGRPPFVASSAETTRVKAAQGDVSECFAKLDECGAEPELVALCKWCLSPKPDDRPSNAGDVATAVAEHRAAAAERARQAELEGVKASARRKQRRTQLVLWTVIGLMFAAMGVGYALASLWRNAEDAKGKALAAQEETEAARERLARVEYGRTIQVAYMEFRDHNVSAARALLASTRPDFRGWEYHHVHRLCHEELFTIRPPSDALDEFGCAISPDKSRAAVRGPGSTIGIWDLKTGTQLHTLRGHTGKLVYADFSRDGSRLVTDSTDDTTRVWDARTGAALHTLPRQYSPYRSSTFSPDGSRILTVDAECIAKVWDAKTGAELFTAMDHTDELIRPTMNYDGSRLLGGVPGKRAKVWNTKTGAETFTLKDLPHADEDLGDLDVPGTLSAFFSPDGSSIAVSSSTQFQVKVWDARTGAERFTRPGRCVPLDLYWRVGFTPDGTRFLTQTGEDFVVRVWDAKTGKEVVQLKGHSEMVSWACLSDHDTNLIAISWEGPIKVWDLRKGTEVRSLRPHATGTVFAASHPDHSLLLTGGIDGTAKLLDAKTGAELRILRGATDQLVDGGFSTDGTRIIISSSTGAIQVWETQSEWDTIIPPAKSSIFAFTLDWKQYLSSEDGRLLTLRDAKTGAMQREFPNDLETIHVVEFNREGTRFVSCGTEGTVKIWDTKTGSILQRLVGHSKPVISCGFNEDGTRVVSSGHDRTIRVWDADSGAELFTRTEPEPVYSFDISPDGTKLAIGSNDGTVRIWEIRTGTELLAIPGQVNWGGGAFGFSSDGTRIFTTGTDNSVRLRDAATGKELVAFRGHTRFVVAAELSPDETRLLTSSQDGTVKLWDARSGVELLTLRTQMSSFAATFSPDGKRILCMGSNLAVIWDSRPFRETRLEQQAAPAVPPKK